MIIQFTLANYGSFHKEQTISFRATGLTSEDPAVDERNVVDVGKHKYLKVVGLYGANGSGKSNFIKGMSFFNEMVKRSLEVDQLGRAGMKPFRLARASGDDAGYFQIVLLAEGTRYRYGFTLNHDGTIQAEWLFGPADRNETYYFKRTGQALTINEDRFKEGYALPKDKLRSDALFLTFCASYNGEVSASIRNYVADKITIDKDGIIPRGPLGRFFRRSSVTDKLLEDGKKDVVLRWMNEAGLVYQDVSFKSHTLDKDVELKRNEVSFIKPTYNDKGEINGQVEMDLDRDESDGTQKYYAYIGMLYRKFQDGGIFISDEIDSSFHPSLLRKIIGLFQNSTLNKANAQLLFTSHDTNVMKPQYMRRDQFYFAEKTVFEETKLYALADLRGIRNNADFASQYLAGYYGALPQLDNYLEDKAPDIKEPYVKR
jgi:AAA15 family ATPase/GTPase